MSDAPGLYIVLCRSRILRWKHFNHFFSSTGLPSTAPGRLLGLWCNWPIVMSRHIITAYAVGDFFSSLGSDVSISSVRNMPSPQISGPLGRHGPFAQGIMSSS